MVIQISDCGLRMVGVRMSQERLDTVCPSSTHTRS